MDSSADLGTGGKGRRPLDHLCAHQYGKWIADPSLAFFSSQSRCGIHLRGPCAGRIASSTTGTCRATIRSLRDKPILCIQNEEETFTQAQNVWRQIIPRRIDRYANFVKEMHSVLKQLLLFLRRTCSNLTGKFPIQAAHSAQPQCIGLGFRLSNSPYCASHWSSTAFRL